MSVFACLLALGGAGCRTSAPTGTPLDPNYRPPSPNDALALSGGKITQFIPSPTNNPADPSDRVMLKACRQIRGIGNSARSGIVVITFYSSVVGKPEKTATSALVVGNEVLVQPAAVSRFMGLEDAIALDTTFTIYPYFQQKPLYIIRLTPDSRFASVGGVLVPLQQPVIWVEPEKQQVMLLSDLAKLFRVSDAQAGNHSILKTKVIYKMPLGPVSTW